MTRLPRSFGALAGLMLLSACLVTPGRFDSSLDIRADGQFTFSYKGEILAADSMKDGVIPPGMGGEDDADGATAGPALLQIAAKQDDFPSGKAGDETDMRAIADALSKEKGFRSVRYLGSRKFAIDYAVSGRLTHAFLFPFNTDAQIILPFVAVELRGDDRVRVKAPGFSNGFDKSQGPAGMAGGNDAAKALDGRFTLTTDAEIVSQNQEDGARTVPAGRQIVWTITPATSDAPAASLRLQR
ncbi:hypothetical protein J3E64_000686 [Sphingobium sp. OAS761]|uniref:hypothetical protein n=1 Tax=Sphingobium sp. OAS761 TaxID=2817901 RepID=UPI0020A06B9B|nr:hypothetical protein [Sphingobium sp. OAS761]MCP1469015.1 hypothetical protein [Sphingobium sp. OAS761]